MLPVLVLPGKLCFQERCGVQVLSISVSQSIAPCWSLISKREQLGQLQINDTQCSKAGQSFPTGTVERGHGLMRSLSTAWRRSPMRWPRQAEEEADKLKKGHVLDSKEETFFINI